MPPDDDKGDRIKATSAQLRDHTWAWSHRRALREMRVDLVDGAGPTTPTPTPTRSADKGDRVKATSAQLRDHAWAWSNREALRQGLVDLAD